MMKKVLLLLLVALAFFEASATHIVGGGFHYRRVSGNLYRFSLTLYFDFLNGNSGAKDPSAKCYIFEKGSNQLIDSLTFVLVDSSRFLPFSNPICAFGSNIRTQILVYESSLVMSPVQFNHPAGYYMVWDRCCRNNIISNILSPGQTGQTFFMEFPAVWLNNASFVNNAPQFTSINSDYPCIGVPFKLSFQCQDTDGDSLAYSLTDPLDGYANPSRPANFGAFPEPYPIVKWRPDFNAANPIPSTNGTQLNSQTGLLTLTATTVGLYVFSVKCEEYRQGKKIGEVRREMQILVKDCLPNDPPKLIVGLPNENRMAKNGDTLRFQSNSVSACYSLKLSDRNVNQRIRFQAQAYSTTTPATLNTDTTFLVLRATDSVSVRFCFGPCAATPVGSPWRILLTATDDGCSQPLSDSLWLYVVIEPKPALPPTIQKIGSFADTIQIIQTEALSLRFEAKTSEPGNLMLASILLDSAGQPIPIQSNGIRLPSGTGNRVYVGEFSWPEICFIPEKQPLKLRTIVYQTLCGQTLTDTIFQYFYIKPKTLKVEISSEYDGATPLLVSENSVLQFGLIGEASENRGVFLNVSGPLKNVAGFSFPEVGASGRVRSLFQFKPDCSYPSDLQTIWFYASSQFCNTWYRDSISYKVQVQFASDSLGPIPNLITVNGDDKNDAFSLSTIPTGPNCRLNFISVEIVNRWGQRVFYSEDPRFAWKPEDLNSAYYFFFLKFKEKEFRNWIWVLKEK